MRVALILNKAAAYDRGLFKGIVGFPYIGSPWTFFFEAPYFANKEQYKKLFEKLKNWKPDCLITNEYYFTPKLIELGIPLLVTPDTENVAGVINIVADNAKIGELGGKYFIEKGFKNLAFYGTDKIFWSKTRRFAYKQLVKSSNLNYFELEAYLHEKWHENPLRLKEFLASLPKPVGIMACQDEFGIQVIESAKQSGFKVPDEVAVLGVDNDFFICGLLNPPLSSIDQQVEKVGFEVARLLQSHFLKGINLPNVIEGKEFRVVARQSTDIFAVEDRELKKALEFIRITAEKKSLTVNDVVGATCLSRRPLELRFRNVLNRSILQEIRRERINIACSYLTNTPLSISEIAYLMDFNSPPNFTSMFKKETTYTCSEYRKLHQNIHAVEVLDE